MNIKATRDSDGKVWIPGALNLFDTLIGRQGEHSILSGDEVYIQPHVYLSFHLIQMHLAGWNEVDFDQLAVVSGASALFAYQPGEFMPKYAHVLIDPDQRISRATGFGYAWEEFAETEKVWDIIIKNIDGGLPLKGWDWENILFAGYRPGNSPSDRGVFAIADGPETYARWLSWSEFVEWANRVINWGAARLGHYARSIEPEPERVTAMHVLREIVEWSETPPEPVLEQYPQATFGLKGIEAYANHIENHPLEEDLVACHDINGQWCLRNSTSVYLQRIAQAKIFPDQINQHLLAASLDYHKAYESWKEMYFQHIGHPVPPEARMTNVNRQSAALAVCRAMMYEKSGIHEITHALQVERMI